jgi:hypothetical protein
VIPGKNGELIQSSNQIPPGSNVAGYEDPKSEDRKGVHEEAAIVRTLLSLAPAPWEFNGRRVWRDYKSRGGCLLRGKFSGNGGVILIVRVNSSLKLLT